MRSEIFLFAHALKEQSTTSIIFNSNLFAYSEIVPKIVKFINKYFYGIPFIGVGATLCRYTNTIHLYSSHEDKKRYQNISKKELCLNFGSGSFSHHYWSNFDYPGVTKYYKALLGKPYKDYTPIDLCEKNLRIDLDDESTKLIYMSHVLEHLEQDKGEHLLGEFCRILKPGGVLRIAIPDDHKLMQYASYLNDQDGFSEDVKSLGAWAAIQYIFKDAKLKSKEELYELAKSVNFSIEAIRDKLSIDLKEMHLFKNIDPSRHITHWSNEMIFDLSKKVNFHKCMLLFRGHTNALPFENLNVFDLTESQNSRYFEFIK